MDDIITYYSSNEDEFGNAEEWDVVQDMIGDLCEVGSEYYSAKFKPLKSSDIINVDDILERFDEVFYDICALDVAPFNELSEDSVNELKTLLVNWMDKNVDISKFYDYVGPTETHYITEEQMLEYGNE